MFHILVVDDDKNTRKYLKAVLETETAGEHRGRKPPTPSGEKLRQDEGTRRSAVWGANLREGLRGGGAWPSLLPLRSPALLGTPRPPAWPYATFRARSDGSEDSWVPGLGARPPSRPP